LGLAVGSKGIDVDGVMEYEVLGIDGGIGDGSGDRPVSEISVLEDSAPGDVVVALQPKKELILFPGVFGWRGSFTGKDMLRALESMCKGGGRFVGGCKAIVLGRLWCEEEVGEGRTGMNGSLTRRLCTGVPFVNCDLYR
jgi:hypothetical protein